MVLTRSRAQTRSEVCQCNEDSNPKLRHGHKQGNDVHIHTVRLSVIPLHTLSCHSELYASLSF